MTKYTVIFLILFFFCPFLANEDASAAQTLNQSDFNKGVMLFKQGEYQASYEVLLQAFEKMPGSRELNFYLGRAAFEIGNYEMAVMTFERILITSPDAQRVKLEIARTFHKLGANDVARQYCRQVLDSDPPNQVRHNIEKFLILMDQSETVHFLSGFLTTGIEWNDNVWATPSTKVIQSVIGDINLSGPTSRKTRDYIYSTTLGLNHVYKYPFTKHTWKTDGFFYTSADDTTDGLDLSLMSVQTGPDLTFGHNRVGLKLSAVQARLDYEAFLDAFGINISWDHMVNPGVILNTTAGVKDNNYVGTPAKDSVQYTGGAGIGFAFKDNWFSLNTKVQKEDAFDDEHSFNRVSGSLSAIRKLAFGFTGSLNYEYQHTQYKEPESLFAQKRKDDIHTVGCGLRKKIWDSKKHKNNNAVLNLNYQRVWADSNIALYEYTKDVVQFSLTYNF